jgi:hypothetical protein
VQGAARASFHIGHRLGAARLSSTFEMQGAEALLLSLNPLLSPAVLQPTEGSAAGALATCRWQSQLLCPLTGPSEAAAAAALPHRRQWGCAALRVTTASMLPCGSEVAT